MMRTLIKKATAIEELSYSLGNIAKDDKKSIDEYTDQEIVKEAKYVLDLFVNPSQGHINHEALCGDEGEERCKWARKQVSQLRSLIKSYA